MTGPTAEHPIPVARATAEDAPAFLAAVDATLHELIDRRGGEVAEATRRPVDAGGKRLRPLLVAAARPRTLDEIGNASRAERFDQCARRAGAAVELIHTASLIHDDVLDVAYVRRGVPTISASHGAEAATAAGDYCFSLAFEALLDCRRDADAAIVSDAVAILAATGRTLAWGEALQDRQTRDATLTRVDYDARCSAKTGVLFATALQLGACFGQLDARERTLLTSFGIDVGIAFQMTDDILDCGEPSMISVLGKRPGADVRDGTITLPMLHAIAADPPLASVLGGPPISDENVDSVLARIRDTGALDVARTDALALRDQALETLEQLAPYVDVRPLAQIAHNSVDRLR